MKLIIDRIENGIAVCEYGEETQIKLPADLLPENAKEGSVLTISVDEEETEKRKKKNKTLRINLFGKD